MRQDLITETAGRGARQAREVVFTNARIVTRTAVRAGTLVVRDGRIADVEAGHSGLAAAEDLGGDLLIPGLVELHTDNLERHLQPRPTARWPTAPAIAAHDGQIVASGITTVLDALAVGDYRDSGLRLAVLRDATAAIHRAQLAGLLRAEHLLHLRCEVTHAQVVELFEPLRDHPLLRLVSLMDHTPGQRQFADLDRYRAFFADSANPAALEENIARRRADQAAHAEGNRRALLALLDGAGLPIASHDDTTPEHVAEAAADGITIAEFPTTLAAAEAARAHGLGVVMGAPNLVRGGSHSGNVAAGDLAGRGLLDAFSSDYAPISLLHAAWLAHQQAGLTLPDAVATVTASPARLAGLEDRGRLAPGLRADLVRVHPTPGHPVIRAVWRAGERVF